MPVENNMYPQTRTRDVVIEVCPKCNTLHYYISNGGLLDINGQYKAEVKCGQQVGWLESNEGETELKPKLCDYVIKAKEDNSFTIRHFTLRERQEYQKLAFPTGEEKPELVSNNPAVVDYCLIHGVTKSPMSLKTSEDIANAPVIGAVLIQLYIAVLQYNQPPLPRLSRLPAQSTQTTQQ